MGSESSNSGSNSSRSDSSSNSGNLNGELEKMICLKENENTIINRVWIVKKSISFFDLKVGGPTIIEPKVLIKCLNIITVSDKIMCKHWAIILELSNGSYANIQFGRNGFSLKEFNKADKEGENILNSITETWGQIGAPYHFCFLGIAKCEYEKLKRYLEEIKKKETKKFEEEGKTYYNLFHYNCQHFACEIEKVLFDKIKIWHSFDFNLNEFHKNFFPDNSAFSRFIRN